MQRDSVQFLSNTPVQVALKFKDGRLGNWGYGDRVLYTCTDGRAMFLDVDVAAKINALELQPGEPFWIEKARPHAKGANPVWKVWRGAENEPATLDHESALARDLRHSLNSNGHGVLVVSRVETNGAVGTAPGGKNGGADGGNVKAAAPVAESQTTPHHSPIKTGWTQQLLQATNDLVDVFAAACRHAEGQGVAPAVVRTILLSAYIGLQRKGGAR